MVKTQGLLKDFLKILKIHQFSSEQIFLYSVTYTFNLTH